MKCQHCGAELSDNSVFCNICGKPVGEEEPKTSGRHHRTITHEKTHTTQRHRSEKKRRHADEDDARYETISFEKPKKTTDRRADWERSVGDDKRYASLAFDLPEAPAKAPEAPAAGRANEINLNLGEAAPEPAPTPSYAEEAPYPYPEEEADSRFKKSQKKTTAVWISVIALLLVIAIVTGAIFIFSRGKKKGSPEGKDAPAATEPAYVDADVQPDDPEMNAFLTEFINGTYTPSQESNDEAKEAEQKEENNSRESSEANDSIAAANEEIMADMEENAKAASVSDPSVNVEYDCRVAAEGSSNLLEAIMNEPSCVYMTQSGEENGLYPIDGYTSNSYELVYIPSDWESLPDGLENGLGEVRSYKTENINWICTNIFNISEADINALYAEANSSHKIWKSRNGTEYMTFIPYDDTPVPDCTVSVSEVKMSPDGAYYYVKYNVVSENQADSFYAVLGKKSIEGKDYWTMYRNTAAVPAEIEPFSLNG